MCDGVPKRIVDLADLSSRFGIIEIKIIRGDKKSSASVCLVSSWNFSSTCSATLGLVCKASLIGYSPRAKRLIVSIISSFVDSLLIKAAAWALSARNSRSSSGEELNISKEIFVKRCFNLWLF